jgi:hypothetical protein
MSRNLARPFFPVPPKEYDPRYMASLAEAFLVYLQQQQNPGEGRMTTLTLTAVPDNDSGLEVGTVFHVAGVLHIAQAHNPHVVGLTAAAAVGTVAVLTP